MRIPVLLFLWLSAVALAPTSFAQDTGGLVQIGPVDTWVESETVPSQPFILAADRTHVYHIISRQRRHTRETSARYYRYRESFKSKAAVEDNAEISVEIDPSYETLVFHHIRVERNAEIISHTDKAQFDIYRVETDRDELVYNKAVNVSYFIPDLRAGDILDYAFTVKGRNPALGPHFSQRSQLQYRPPIQYFIERTLIDKDMDVHVDWIGGAPAPTIRKKPTTIEYRWEMDDVPGKVSEENQPYWTWDYPTGVFSTFYDWPDVGAYFAKYYKPPETLPKVLEDEATKIRQAHFDKKAQTRAALDYVQREIRYLALNYGAGGFIPRSPETVLYRRFGDCKDVTLLLLTLLHALDIPATPILVDSDYRSEIGRLPVAHNVFDHIVLRATVDGKPYFLDATRGEQLGTLDTMAQAAYGKGLEVASPSAGLISMNEQPYPWSAVFTSQYTIKKASPAVDFNMVMQFFGGRADAVKSWIEREGIEHVGKEYKDYYLDSFPSLKEAGDLTVDTDHKAAVLTMTLPYVIEEAWIANEDGDSEDFDAFPREINDDIPRFSGENRTAPYSLRHPVRIKETQIFKLDETWDIEPDAFTEANDSFRYTRKERFEEGVFQIDYEYRTLQDHIAPDAFARIMAKLNEINDNLGTNLYRPIDGKIALKFNTEEEEESSIIGIAVLVAVGLLILAGLAYLGIYSARKDLAWRHEAVFYPVKLPVFLLMTIMTFGVYIAYWLFKNWQWVRSVQNVKVYPIWCTIFSSITCIFLYLRIARYPRRENNWFLWIAVPLAVLSLGINIITTLSDENWSFVLAVLAPFLFVPPAIRIQQLNAGASHIVERYSRFGWEKIVSIIVGALFWILIGFGMYTGEI